MQHPQTRKQFARNCGVAVEVLAARLDEQCCRSNGVAQGYHTRTGMCVPAVAGNDRSNQPVIGLVRDERRRRERIPFDENPMAHANRDGKDFAEIVEFLSTE